MYGRRTLAQHQAAWDRISTLPIHETTPRDADDWDQLMDAMPLFLQAAAERDQLEKEKGP